MSAPEEKGSPGSRFGMSGPDRVVLRGLRVLGTHGVLPEERERPQPFEIDLLVHADLDAAAHSDELAETVDYARVAELVVEVVGKTSFSLMEALAGAISDAVLGLPGVSGVTVSLRKLRPPVPADLASAGVTITRTQS